MSWKYTEIISPPRNLLEIYLQSLWEIVQPFVADVPHSSCMSVVFNMQGNRA